MKVAVACDHAGLALKEEVKNGWLLTASPAKIWLQLLAVGGLC